MLIDLFLPRTCHVCGTRLTKSEHFICHPCAQNLPLTRYDTYWRNADPTRPNSDINPMETRFAGQLPFIHACAPYFYTRDSALAQLVHDFKYRGFSRLAAELGRMGAETLKDSGFFDDIDILLPVPLHITKRYRRGYNQSAMIAEGVSRATGIPVGKNLVARRSHRTQTALNAMERLENTRGVFKIKKPGELSGKAILLVDDICTTGATLIAAGEAVLAGAPSASLSFFTLGVV